MNTVTVGAFLAAGLVLSGRLKTETIAGYAEYKRGDTLIVEGQRVVATPSTKVKGAKRLVEIPLGNEVKATGQRNSAGVLVAQAVETRPNTNTSTEQQIIAASNDA